MTRTIITKQDLNNRVEQLRHLTGRDFYLQGAYGGWQLHESIGSGSAPCSPGFVSKRQMEDRLNAMIEGFHMGERSQRERIAREQEKIYGQTLTPPFNGAY